MTDSLVYPRLPLGAARELLAEIRDAQERGVAAVAKLAAISHPKAAPVATGGREATADELLTVRVAVLDEVGPWVDQGSISRKQQPKFDARLGRALHEALRIVPADAAHPGTWNFLTLVLLPDVAVTRFSDLPDDRGLGTKRERNVLSRAWIRWAALGDLLDQGDPVLGEDELVGLLERTAVARNRVLVIELARAIIAYDGKTARSEFARNLYKLVRYRTGPLMLDLLSQAELSAVVDAEVHKIN
jgi:hypothetical protein